MPSHLTALLDELSDGLAGVTLKRMFGHDALFAFGNIFALEWDGRVGVRLPSEVDFDLAMREDGSTPFDPMSAGKGMAHWVILSADFLDEPRRLREWVARAHALNSALPPKAKKPTKAKK